MLFSALISGTIFNVQHTAFALNSSTSDNWLAERLDRAREAIEEGNSTETVRILNMTQSLVINIKKFLTNN